MPIGARPARILLDERLADDAHRRPAAGVPLGECPAGDDRNGQRCEIRRADHVIRRSGFSPSGRGRSPTISNGCENHPPSNGSTPPRPTLLTPGCPRPRARRRRRTPQRLGRRISRRAAGPGNGNVSVIVSTSLGAIAGIDAVQRQQVRSSRPAPLSSSTAAATSPTTSRRAYARRAAWPRPSRRITCTSEAPVACQAGASPNINADGQRRQRRRT